MLSGVDVGGRSGPRDGPHGGDLERPECGTFWEGEGMCSEWPSVAVPISTHPGWHRAAGQVTSVKRKEMAAKANDHPYL